MSGWIQFHLTNRNLQRITAPLGLKSKFSCDYIIAYNVQYLPEGQHCQKGMERQTTTVT